MNEYISVSGDSTTVGDYNETTTYTYARPEIYSFEI